MRRVAKAPGAAPPPSVQVYDWLDNASLYFYLRGIKNVRFRTAADVAAASPSTDMILIDEPQRGALAPSLESSHHIERFQLRPNMWALLYVRQTLWDRAEGGGSR